MQPTRRTQPYRQGPRQPGAALDAMLRGSGVAGWNPIDTHRAGFLIAAGKRREGRPGRPPRPPRAARTPRTPR